MLVASQVAPAFGWRTSYEIQTFRDGKWVISTVYDDRGIALDEARRLDRLGRMVRLTEEQFNRSTKNQRAQTIYISSRIKKSWKEEQDRIVALGVAGPRLRARTRRDKAPNPYYLLTIFTLVMFAGIAAVFALRSLHDMV